MLGRFYYFPIKGKQLVLSDNLESALIPIVSHELFIGKRLNYNHMASKLLHVVFRDWTNLNSVDDEKAYALACNTLSQVHVSYSKENGEDYINAYFTFKLDEYKLGQYENTVDITKNCLNGWPTDDSTRNIVLTEIERMQEIYERM